MAETVERTQAIAGIPSTKGLNLSQFFKTDVAFALGLITILAVLILPMPPMLLDMALAMSIALSVLILMTALFISKPLEFSIFPTVLLVSTMIRLSLNVASTRLILSHGHEGTAAAGKVIQAFGTFIMQGNFVIGLIVFSILVIVNFVVITKGSGRIAEVSARFSLDAMPGKQMAIDADLSAGLIDETEAKRRRRELEDESNFFGAMDGAAKFVRGDAIAGLLITLINIVGGIIIGVAQMDMSMMDATTNFTSLTVGDGLVTQVPALIVSTAAGMLVSKAGVEGTADKALFNQLSAYPSALGMSSVLMGGLALLPQIPILPFATLAILTGAAAYALSQDKKKQAEEAATSSSAAETGTAEEKEEPLSKVFDIDQIRIELGYGLLSLLNGGGGKKLTEQIKQLRKQMASEIGFILPSVRIQDNIQLGANEYVIRIKEMEASRGDLRPEMLMVMDPHGGSLTLDGEHTTEPTFGLPAMWINSLQRHEAEAKGYTIVEPSTVMTTHLTQIVKDNISELLTYADTQQMLEDLGPTYKRLLEDLVPNQITVGGIQRVLQNLVSEQVSIRDLPAILEGIAEACTMSRNIALVTEHVRQRLSRQITYSHANAAGVLKVILLSPQWEEAFSQSLIGDGEIKQLALPPTEMQKFVTKVKDTFDRITMTGETAILITSTPLRLYIRSVIERIRPAMVVMAQNEVHPRATIQQVAVI